MTLTALLDLTLKPEAVSTALPIIHETLAATRAFDGCLGVDVLADTADPAHIVIIERWDSVDSDAAYRSWRATPDGASALRTILAGPPRLTKYNLEPDI